MPWVCSLVLLSLASWLAPAQQAPAVPELPELNARLLELHAQMSVSTPAQAVGLRNQAAALIQQRQRALSALIAQNPQQALALAFSEGVLAQLAASFPAPAAQLESRGIWQGELEYLIQDDVSRTTSRRHLRLRVAQEVLELHLAAAEPPGLKSGVQLQVAGLRAGDRVAVETAALLPAAEPLVCSTLGAQPVVTILVDLQSFPLDAGMTHDFVRGVLLGNAFAPTSQSNPDRSVDHFWRENSDGKASVDSAVSLVVGPYTLPGDYNTDDDCDFESLREDAIAAADADVNFANFTRVMIVFPPNNACTFAGLGSIGCFTNHSDGENDFTASVAWNRADQMDTRSSGVQLITHEAGHNLGLAHGNSRDFGPEPLGPVLSSGFDTEYGDPFSTMGAWNFGFYSAPHAAEQLNWLDLTTNYLAVETNGTHTIQNYETRPAGLKALKVRRGTGNDEWLWIEYRQNTGLYDSQLDPHVWSGILIHHVNSWNDPIATYLPDFDQPALNDWTDAALPAGSSWIDPYSDLVITVSNAGPSGVDVTVAYIPNDNFSNATPILLSPFTSGLAVTSGFSTELADPVPSCGNGSRGRSAWYRFTPGVSGTTFADVITADYNTILSVYTGSPGSFSEVACNDDAGGGSASHVSFPVLAGVTYSVMVSAFDNDGGSLVVSIAFPDTNDNFSNAIPITGSPFTSTINTSWFTVEGTTEPVPCGTGSRTNSAWYTLTPAQNGMVAADTFGSSYDTILAAYSANPGLSEVACNDDAGGGLQSQVSFAVTAGITYYLMITDSNPGGTGGGLLTLHFTLSASTGARRPGQLISD